jgi:hypothetical protein
METTLFQQIISSFIDSAKSDSTELDKVYTNIFKDVKM